MKRWLIRLAGAFAFLAVILMIVAALAARRIDPYVREQAVKYLRDRFDGEVEVGSIHVSVPPMALIRLAFFAGQGALITATGENVLLRHKGRRDIPPLFVLKHFKATIDLGTLFGDAKAVPEVVLDGMEIHIPPKGERDFKKNASAEAPTALPQDGKKISVVIEHVTIRDALLEILPRDRAKVPLRFDLHDIRLKSAGKDVAMTYDALLRNPKPPGEIQSKGTFGPWASGEPGDTPLGGDYVFENADLGVFKGIAGILRSTGSFDGTLSAINARGTATIPDFRLKQANNAVPLTAEFEVGVDGTNGNTELKPVHATLGSTKLSTKGIVVKHDGDLRRTIDLQASIPAGDLRDILRLAMKGTPTMIGTLRLDTKIVIPPLSGKVKEKLQLDGEFDITGGRFLRSQIQDRIDAFARRGKGQPKNMEIDEVIHRMSGDFDMADEVITFHNLAFEIPGAAVNLGGSVDLGSEALDLHGAMMLDAKVSQTMEGWKRWALKPLDPFFSKRGAGTFLHIKITGTTKAPQFGADPGGTSPMEEREKAAGQ